MALASQIVPANQAYPSRGGNGAISPHVDYARQMKIHERMKEIVHSKASEANRRVGLRQALENRWIEDLEQYNGQYDHKTQEALNDGNKSKLFINLTQSKTDAMSARLMDLLFPTDDKNWGIQPTPVPELSEAVSQALAQFRELEEQAKQQSANGEGVTPEQAKQLTELEIHVKSLKAIIDEARKRAEAMEREIDDQLKESNYHAVSRDQIEDACKLGTGVVKGPITGDKVRKGWKKRQVEQTGAGGMPMIGRDGQPVMQEIDEYDLKMSVGEQPAMRYVDIWSFFPDMDARKIEEANGTFERHLMTPKMLREFARLEGVDQDAVRRILRQKPAETAPSYLASLRNLKQDLQQIGNAFYHVWEYSGPLEPEEMRDLALAMGDEATVQELGEIDPLMEVHAVIWFCQEELLRFTIYPLDSNECMYSVFNLSKEEASIFGKGIPAMMRDPQSSLNAAWRAMMDNAGLATGPQIVVDRTIIEPANGVWELEPRKIWYSKKSIPREDRAFASFNIDMHQEPLANIIALSKQFIDDMTAMPAIAQGEQGSNVTKTAQGMALLMNSTNVVFRRIVKNYDDDVTTPNIRRFYDWNMQFNPKKAIKGDYCIDARGSSVLLVREMQAQNLMMIAMQLGQHPVYGPMLKNRDVLRMLFKAHMIPADEVVLSDDEIDAVLADAAAQAEAATQAQEDAANLQIQIANMNNDTKLKIAHLNKEVALITAATNANMGMDKIEAMLEKSRNELMSKERGLAVETAMAAKTGEHAGGSV